MIILEEYLAGFLLALFACKINRYRSRRLYSTSAVSTPPKTTWRTRGTDGGSTDVSPANASSFQGNVLQLGYFRLWAQPFACCSWSEHCCAASRPCNWTSSTRTDFPSFKTEKPRSIFDRCWKRVPATESRQFTTLTTYFTERRHTNPRSNNNSSERPKANNIKITLIQRSNRTGSAFQRYKKEQKTNTRKKSNSRLPRNFFKFDFDPHKQVQKKS